MASQTPNYLYKASTSMATPNPMPIAVEAISREDAGRKRPNEPETETSSLLVLSFLFVIGGNLGCLHAWYYAWVCKSIYCSGSMVRSLPSKAAEYILIKAPRKVPQGSLSKKVRLVAGVGELKLLICKDTLVTGFAFVNLRCFPGLSSFGFCAGDQSTSEEW